MEFITVDLHFQKSPISDVKFGIDRIYTAHNACRDKVFDNLAEYFDEKASYARVLGGIALQTAIHKPVAPLSCYTWQRVGTGINTQTELPNDLTT